MRYLEEHFCNSVDANPPRGIPKTSFISICYENLGHGVEELHIRLVAR
jgi:hypothetical protein